MGWFAAGTAKMALQRCMTHRCDVYRCHEEAEGPVEFTRYTPVSAGTRCRLARANTHTAIHRGMPETVVSGLFKLFGAADMDVEPGDRVVVEGLEFDAGLVTRYENHAEAALYRRVRA